MDSLADKITDMECKFAFQQETIDTLNAEVTKQWVEIDKLNKALHRMHEQLSSVEASAGKPDVEPPPPHY